MIEAGRAFAAARGIDSLIGLGGGSSLDCAKGINFVLTNGGSMRDYWGYGKAARPMLPMIAVPTTAGTGSEAQSYALISDAGDAREDGLRRSEGRVSRGDSRSAADALAAARGDRGRRLRRDLARGRELRDHAAQRRLAECSRAKPGGCCRRISSAC